MPYYLLCHFVFLLKRHNIPCHLAIPCLQVVSKISHVGGGSAAIVKTLLTGKISWSHVVYVFDALFAPCVPLFCCSFANKCVQFVYFCFLCVDICFLVPITG